MELKNIILIAIAILFIALVCVGAYVLTSNQSNDFKNITDGLNNITDKNNTNITVNKTSKVVGDNSTRSNSTANKTYKVYNPQSDSYVPVIGEKYDDEVNRWYTYDTDGVRYYNTRIN